MEKLKQIGFIFGLSEADKAFLYQLPVLYLIEKGPPDTLKKQDEKARRQCAKIIATCLMEKIKEKPNLFAVFSPIMSDVVYASLRVDKQDYVASVNKCFVSKTETQKNGYRSLSQLVDEFNLTCGRYAVLSNPSDTTENKWEFYFRFVFQ
jgi:hypothetical protein